MIPTEVTFDVFSGRIVEWDMLVGNPPPLEEAPPSSMLFEASDIHTGLLPGGVAGYRSTMTVRSDGFAHVTFPGHPTVIYELFPMRFSDGKPYEPLCYVGRWPD